jgi:hypothetical protein
MRLSSGGRRDVLRLRGEELGLEAPFDPVGKHGALARPTPWPVLSPAGRA